MEIKNKPMSDKQKAFVDNKIKVMTDTVLKGLEDGTAPFIIPWEAGKSPQTPHNPITGTNYSGINSLVLTMQNRTDPRWMTGKNANDNHGGIKQGESGTPIQFWKFFADVDKKDSNGNLVKDEEGNQVKVKIPLANPICKIFTVFNGDQINDIEPYVHDTSQTKEEWKRHEDAEKILNNSTVEINHLNGNRAFYSPSKDAITLPERGQFNSDDNYYATAMHELGHSTGASHRLNRDLSNPFGSEGYAKEELIAEISSWQMNLELQLGHDPAQHAGYIQSWIAAIKDDPDIIARSCTAADKAATYNLQLLHTNEKDILNANEISEKSMSNSNDVSTKIAPKDDRYLALGLFDKAATNDAPVYRLVDSIEGSVLTPTSETNTTNGKAVFKFDKVSILKTDDLTEDEIQVKIDSAIEKGVDAVVIMSGDAEKEIINVSGNKFNNIGSMLQTSDNKVFLDVPFNERDMAKKNGAAWSSDANSWFFPKDATNSTAFKDWDQDRVYDSVSQQFKTFIEDNGGILEGQPKLDGKIHRIPSINGKAGNSDVAYQGYNDEHPAGWVKDWRGEQSNWKAQGSKSLTQEEKEALSLNAKKVAEEREKVRDSTYNEKAVESQSFTDSLEPLTDSKYHDSKGLVFNSESNIKQDAKGNLILPMKDADGKQWTHTTLQSNGFKQLYKGAKLQGSFFLVGAKNLGDKPDAILVCEGYSTGCAIENSINKPVVVATHADNLISVTSSLREKFPEARIYVFADNDENLESKGLENKGMVKAEEAAKNVNGSVIKPHFENKEPSKERTDFHDMLKISGSKVVKNHVNAQVKMIRAKENLDKSKNNDIERDQIISRSQKQSMDR